MKHNMSILIISLFCFSLMTGEGFSPETLVKATDKSIAIHELAKGQKLFSYDFAHQKVTTSSILAMSQKRVDEYCKITIADESIICARDQTFFSVNHHEWIAADQFMIGDALLAHSGLVVIDAIELVCEPKDLYIIGLSPPHNFYVGRHEICAHNFVIETVCGISYFMSSGGGALIVKAALNVAGFAIASLFVSRSKKSHQSRQQAEVRVSASFGGSPDPNDPSNRRNGIIKVNNMQEFFETEFGKEIRPHLEKTKEIRQGQSVYHVKKDVPKYGLRKGDQLYLDALHKDHLEVFGRSGKARLVLNLDGTENVIKGDVSCGRKIQ